MSVENDFLPFAVGAGANVLSQSAYAALTTLTQNGFQAGIAPSIQLNKVWRQSSIMAAVVAQFIVAQTGQTAIDDGTTATLLANFTTAVNAASKSKVVLTDTGAANAYAAANPVPLTVLPTATGFTQTVKIAHTNTGNSTYAPDGLATAPIYGLGGALLQGNEMPTNGVATLVSFVGPLLNSGNLCWVLYECIGGAQQVAAATASQHAMQLGQATGRLLNVQVFLSSGTYTPFSSLVTSVISEVQGAGAGSAGSVATSSTQVSVGGPGSAGGYCKGKFAVGTVSGTAVVVGAAGAAGAAGGNGGNGGNSTFAGMTGGGGGGGGASGAGTSEFAGSSANGSASGGNIINLPGAAGALSFGIAATGFPFAFAGNGGSSPIGGAGGTGAGIGYGGGGGGTANSVSQSAVTGHAGFQGIVIIYEYA